MRTRVLPTACSLPLLLGCSGPRDLPAPNVPEKTPTCALRPESILALDPTAPLAVSLTGGSEWVLFHSPDGAIEARRGDSLGDAPSQLRIADDSLGPLRIVSAAAWGAGLVVLASGAFGHGLHAWVWEPGSEPAPIPLLLPSLPPGQSLRGRVFSSGGGAPPGIRVWSDPASPVSVFSLEGGAPASFSSLEPGDAVGLHGELPLPESFGEDGFRIPLHGVLESCSAGDAEIRASGAASDVRFVTRALGQGRSWITWVTSGSSPRAAVVEVGADCMQVGDVLHIPLPEDVPSPAARFVGDLDTIVVLHSGPLGERRLHMAQSVRSGDPVWAKVDAPSSQFIDLVAFQQDGTVVLRWLDYGDGQAWLREGALECDGQ